MTGQPTLPGVLVFDVTNLEINEPEPPLEHTESIIDYTEPFELTVTFTGAGLQWFNIVRNCNPKYKACFYLEGLGQRVELDLGCETGYVADLKPGGGTYQVTHRVDGIKDYGLFIVGATVEFPGWIGILGYSRDLMIQVSELEH